MHSECSHHNKLPEIKYGYSSMVLSAHMAIVYKLTHKLNTKRVDTDNVELHKMCFVCYIYCVSVFIQKYRHIPCSYIDDTAQYYLK